MQFRREFRKHPGSKNQQSNSDKSILETEILTWVRVVTESLSPKAGCYCSAWPSWGKVRAVRFGDFSEKLDDTCVCV